mgnify:CR=1 FL=1
MPAPVRRGSDAACPIRPVLVAALIVAGLGLGACDKTIRGAGQDIQDTGNAVQDAAQ